MNRLLLGLIITPLVFGSTVQATVQPVTQIVVAKKTSHSVTLRWAKQTGADGYQIRVAKHNGKLLKKVNTHHHKKTVTGLEANKKYRFKVRAKTGEVYGAYSNVVKARTKLDTTPDPTPQTPDPTPTDPGTNTNTNTNSNSNTDSNSNTNSNSNINTNTNTNTNSNTDPTPPTPDPILIGFWGLNGYTSADGFADVQSRFHSTVFQVAEEGHGYTVNTLLPMVQAAGMKITLRLSGGHSAYTTSGNFDLAKWKAAIAGWSGTGIQTYIDNGTIVGHMLLDDIDTFSGTDPTAADLEEMARYSEEEIFPGLMTFVRQKCSNMPTPTANSGQYIYVDNCVNQYTNYPGYSDGPIATYVTQQTAAATALGLGMINGLNIADGGDGSSAQPGATTNHYAMSASEITTYGEALLAVPTIDLFLMWEYDGQQLWSDGSIGSTYFDHTDVQAALAGLGTLAAARTQ